MTARNMVRSLRDSGELENPRPQIRARRRSIILLMLAGMFGIVAVFAAIQGGPSLLKFIEKKPAPVSYMKHPA